jgi:putative transposase
MEELHIAEDHVHIYCSFPPRLSITQVVTRLKSLSARALFKEFPELRRSLFGGELWEGGYFVRTVGDTLTGEVIRRYIRQHSGDQEVPLEEADPQLTLF